MTIPKSVAEAAERLRIATERYQKHDVAWRAYCSAELNERDSEQPQYDELPEDACTLADAYISFIASQQKEAAERGKRTEFDRDDPDIHGH